MKRITYVNNNKFSSVNRQSQYSEEAYKMLMSALEEYATVEKLTAAKRKELADYIHEAYVTRKANNLISEQIDKMSEYVVETITSTLKNNKPKGEASSNDLNYALLLHS
jgi:endonuclease III